MYIIQRLSLHKALFLDAIGVIMASLALIVSAQIAFPLPFSPIPITMQTVVLLLIGACLGPKKGLAAVGLYLFEGAIGLPAFSQGLGGLAILLGPKGGYLIGFLGAVVVAGLAKFLKNNFLIFLSFIAANAAIYMLGLAWLGLFVGYPQVLAIGLMPFIIGDFFKILIAFSCFKGISYFRN